MQRFRSGLTTILSFGVVLNFKLISGARKVDISSIVRDNHVLRVEM